MHWNSSLDGVIYVDPKAKVAKNLALKVRDIEGLHCGSDAN